MTEQELREPPLLSGFKSYSVIFLGAKRKYIAGRSRYDKHTEEAGVAEGCEAVAQAQREADKKWMKEHCYLKAERELPEVEEDCPFARLDEQAKMLKEVDGVSFRACKEFKDAK